MADSKYGHLIKPLTFKDSGPGLTRQGTEMSGKMLGYDVNIQYGAYWSSGQMSPEPYGPRVNDYDQVMVWIGTDTYDMGYLGAEVELELGEEKEKHMITTATGVTVPKGLPYKPGNITRMDDRFIFLTVSLAPELKTKEAALEDRPGHQAVFARSEYHENVQGLAFKRNGPWHYGPNNPDTHDGAITEIQGKDFEFHMSYESMNKAPYRFGPVPDKPHVHPYTEFLLLMGADTDDLSDLGAELEVCMGKEMESHTVTTPSVLIQPKEHPHNPLIVRKQDKPWIFAVVRPWGHGII